MSDVEEWINGLYTYERKNCKVQRREKGQIYDKKFR